MAFGHKFADRCGQATGSDDPNERCPVFLQWLDCVHQILMQFEISFEFSHTYLVSESLVVVNIQILTIFIFLGKIGTTYIFSSFWHILM